MGLLSMYRLRWGRRGSSGRRVNDGDGDGTALGNRGSAQRRPDLVPNSKTESRAQ